MNNAVEEKERMKGSQLTEAQNLEQHDGHLNVRVKEEPQTEQQTTTSNAETDEPQSYQCANRNEEDVNQDISYTHSMSHTKTKLIDSSEPQHESNTSDNTAKSVAINAEALQEPVETGARSSTDEAPNNSHADAEQTTEQSVMDGSIMASGSNPTTVRVKHEPHFNIPETIPDDFFEDLLNNADQLTADLSPSAVNDADYPEAVETSDSIHNSQNKATQIKNEPLSLYESSEVPIGDDLDNISTPRASPQRSVTPEDRLNSTSAVAHVRVKNEINSEVNRSNEEVIPENFFDDLLVDSVAERVARIRDECEEMKYSEQLKTLKEKLRQLDDEEQDDSRDRSKNSSGHKHKSKKSKKKSHKRARSREKRKESEAVVDISESRHSHSKRRNYEGTSVDRDDFDIHPPQINKNYGNLPKVPPLTARVALAETPDVEMYFPIPIPMVKPETSANFDDAPLYGNMNNDVEDVELECLPVQTSGKRTTQDGCDNITGFKKIKLEKHASEPEAPLILTPAMKRQKALQMAADTIQQFHGAKQQTLFYFASTVRKLPASSSYVKQQSYENRSPLHTIHNVRFNFNSHSTRLQLRDWGLEALPKVAAKVARIVGCDADTLCAKLQAAQLSTKYVKIKREQLDGGESIDEIKSSFFTNAMTQTDDVYVLSARRRKANDVGVQVTPICGHISTQTTATSSSMGGTNEDLPLIQLINVLNENQLLALNDFAELIREPADTALDMYRLRTRMLEIYKCSQLPSALANQPHAATVRIAEAPRILNNRPQLNQRQFLSNARDPRTSTSGPPAYYQHDIRSPVDPRLNAVPIQQHRTPQYQDAPPPHGQLHSPGENAPNRYFGRGSVRR